MQRKLLINVVLLMTWLGLLGWIAYQWQHPAQLPEVAPYEPIDVGAVEIARVNTPLVGLPNYENLLERPLFYPERRPPDPDPEPEAPPPPPPPPPPPDEELTLIGVVVMPEGMRALIKEDASREVRRLGPGDNVASWRLEEVAAQQVRLTQGERSRVLSLERNRRQPTLERTPERQAAPDDAEIPPGGLEVLPEESAPDAPPGALPDNELEVRWVPNS